MSIKFMITYDGETLTVLDPKTEEVHLASSGDTEIRTIIIGPPDGVQLEAHLEPGMTIEELLVNIRIDNPGVPWPVELYVDQFGEGVIITAPHGSDVTLEDF